MSRRACYVNINFSCQQNHIMFVCHLALCKLLPKRRACASVACSPFYNETRVSVYVPVYFFFLAGFLAGAASFASVTSVFGLSTLTNSTVKMSVEYGFICPA